MSDATSKSEAATPGTMGRLKGIGELRDGMLVLAGVLYVLGYAVWSINAWKNGLGLLPALDAQYFIAGIFPTLIFALLYAGVRFSWNYSKPAPGWLDPRAKLTGWPRLFRAVLYVIIFVVSSAPILLAWTNLPEKYFPDRQVLLFGILAAFQSGISFGFLFLYNPPPAKEPPTTSERIRRLQVQCFRIVAVAIIGFVALNYYVTLYAKWPQSLGGLRPRCAYLDLRKGGISSETLQTISPAAAPTPLAQPLPSPSASEPEITRSNKLDLLFSGSDYVLIRVRDQVDKNKDKVYEIKKDVIQAIQPCG